MIRLFFLIILIGCKQRQFTTELVEKDTTLKMLKYGLGDMEEYRVLDAVAKKYGFRYFAVAGCVVSKELQDSVAIENAKVDTILQSRFGKDWRKNFQNKVDTLRKKQDLILKLAKTDPYIFNREKELNKTNDHLYFAIDYAGKPNIFYVSCYELGLWDSKPEYVNYHKVLVELNTGLISSVQ